MASDTPVPSRTLPVPISTLAAVLVGGWLLGACAGGPEALQLGLPDGDPGYPGTPQEVYARVARGALGCWFGAGGTLKPTHIFHADMAPAVKGGMGEIVLQERERNAASPRGLKALRITFAPHTETASHMTIEVLRFPGEPGARMRTAVQRWAAGDATCDPAAPTLAGWQPATAGKRTTSKVVTGTLAAKATAAQGALAVPAAAPSSK